MKRTLYVISVAATALMLGSCSKELEVSSPSVVDANFVFTTYETAQTVMLGAYDIYEKSTNVINGHMYNEDSIGSDSERCGVGYIADCVYSANLYPSYGTENFNTEYANGYWANMYKAIAYCNQIIYNIENKENFAEIVASAPNDWSDLLGQAHALRATLYYDFARIWGDVVYVDKVGYETKELSGRDFIMESELQKLIEIEPYMYKVGENSHNPDQMTRNYVDGLIGRICLMEGGYATRRTDLGEDFYKDIDGNVISFTNWGEDTSRKCAYGRRNDWLDFYKIAKPYLEKAVNDPGDVKLITSDPRPTGANGQLFGNPFQYIWQQVMDLTVTDESIYEATKAKTKGASEFGYAYGRASNGGSTAFPPRHAGMNHAWLDFYYGDYDPKDLRRDASIVVTGSTGAGAEIITSYGLSAMVTGGPCYNKWDVNRQSDPYPKMRNSGMNAVVMRQADVILMLAEVYAALGETENAKAQLKKVHERAFATKEDADFDGFVAKFSNLTDAILQERKLEFAGEGTRRFDLVRSGKLPEVAYNFRHTLINRIEEMLVNGYAQYDNGQQCPEYIWTKLVDAKSIYGYRLTTQCPVGMEDDPVLYPSWRGQNDDWQSVADTYNKGKGVTAGNNTNLAIVGLFRYIDPDGDEAKELEADGYTKTVWGAGQYLKGTSYSEAQRYEWAEGFMAGYSDADYAAKKAPVYLVPMEKSVCVNVQLRNGYGFQQYYEGN